MYKTGSYLIWRWTILAACLTTVMFGGFYFLKVSAQTEDAKAPTEQNLVLGRLLFSRTSYSSGGITGSLGTSNADGSGNSGIPTPAILPFQPAWSPDGTKVLYCGGDIFIVNAGGGGDANLTNTQDVFENSPSWSVTGKIAYERGGLIWTMNPDGSNQAHFSAITQPNPKAPAWSHDGTKLAFSSGGGELWVINADGTNQHRVATVGGDPAWSPDDSKLVFSKGIGGIAVINADGSNETPLTGGSIDLQPDWAPDGTKIAFRRNDGDRGIYTMDPNGANLVRIIADISTTVPNSSTVHEDPHWQPVAQTPNTFAISGRILHNNLPVTGATVNLSGTTSASVTTDTVGSYQFSGLAPGGNYTVTPTFTNPKHLFTPASRTFSNLASNQTGNFEVLAVCINGKCVKNGKIAFVRGSDIFTINPDGTNEMNLTNNGANDSEPNYSPSGTNIIFSTNRDGNYEIYRMNSDGSNPVRLTNDASTDTSPVYSPDGASIVFVSNRDGNYEIYKMNADGSNPVRLTNTTSSEGQPSFSPDGTKIVFVSAAAQTPMRIFTMNADGSNPQELPGTVFVGTVYQRPQYSPDGSKIIMVYGSDVLLRTIWTMNADGTNRVQFPNNGLAPTYSPDGLRVAYTCCIFDNSNRLRRADASGNSSQILTPSNNGNDLPDWQAIPLTRRTPFDYDGDGKSDISLFRPSENKWYILQSSNLSLRERAFGAAGDIPTPADYDGDGKTDPAIFRPAAGDWWYLSSINNTQVNVHFGQAGDIPRPSDFDGDGKSDFVVYRPSNNVWYRLGTTGQTSVTQFGASGDQPLVGDFDGDGKSDLAIFRPSTGDWWYAASASGGQHSAVHWGQAGDIPVPGDYDADGKADFVVFRPSSGGWYILRTGEQNYTILSFGLPEDKPVAGDYDGDGKMDVAVWRPSTGVWYLLQTTSGFGAVQFGAAGDVPTENSFLP